MIYKARLSVIFRFFRSKGHFSDFLFKTILVFVIGQQIYCPQEYKYFHLALLFMYMIFTEVFEYEYREFNREYIFLSLIFLCGVISILEKFLGINLGLLYLGVLMFSNVMAVSFIHKVKGVFMDEDKHYMIGKQNWKVLEKGNKFMTILTNLIIFMLMITFIYTAYEIIILFI